MKSPAQALGLVLFCETGRWGERGDIFIEGAGLAYHDPRGRSCAPGPPRPPRLPRPTLLAMTSERLLEGWGVTYPSPGPTTRFRTAPQRRSKVSSYHLTSDPITVALSLASPRLTAHRTQAYTSHARGRRFNPCTAHHLNLGAGPSGPTLLITARTSTSSRPPLRPLAPASRMGEQ